MKLDKFYTKKNISKICIDNVLLDNYMTIIEPSAGDGSFSCLLPTHKTISMDIEPDNENIIKKDFFDFDYTKIEKKILVIGNPPFGKRSKLAIKFFNYSANFADTIAFILPIQFKKWGVQKELDSNFGLQKEIILDPDIFYFKNKEFSVRCCFQIWHNKKSFDFEDLRILEKPKTEHELFIMWQYNNTKQALKYFDKKKFGWNFAVPRQGFYDYNIRETNPDNMNKKIQWIFFKSENEEVLNNIYKINFYELAKKNTTTPGFGKADVVEEYNRLYKEH